MLHVELENIVSEQDTISRVGELLRKADEEKQIIVVTRNGKPAVAILDIAQLEQLSGHEVRPAATPIPSTQPTMAAPVQPAAMPVTPAPQTAPSVNGLPPLDAPQNNTLPDMPSDPII